MGEKKVRLLNRNGVRTAVFLLFVVCTILAIACVIFQLVEWRMPVLVVYFASWILVFSTTRCPHCGRIKVPIRPFRKAPPRCLNCGKELGQEVGSETPVCRRLRNLRSEAGLAPSQVAETSRLISDSLLQVRDRRGRRTGADTHRAGAFFPHHHGLHPWT